MTSGRLQCVNYPYDVIISDRAFTIGDGVLYKNRPMWVVSNTCIDLNVEKIAMIPKAKQANQLTFECTLPIISMKNTLTIQIFNIKKTVCGSSSFVFNPIKKRFSRYGFFL